MHGQYNPAIFRPKAVIHLIYRDLAGAVTERVVLVREIEPDGDGFKGWCLRRIAEGDEGRRLFLFERILWARRWNGKAILDLAGREIIPDRARIQAARRLWRQARYGGDA